jgi:sec-independent protein translocase protein TatA
MFPNVGFPEFLILMGIAVLLFGKRLPEVARSLGKGLVEFKKGLSGMSDELDISGPHDRWSSHNGSGSSWRSEEPGTAGDTTYSDTSVPKFEVPGAPSTPATTAPVEASSELPRD